MSVVVVSDSLANTQRGCACDVQWERRVVYRKGDVRAIECDDPAEAKLIDNITADELAGCAAWSGIDASALAGQAKGNQHDISDEGWLDHTMDILLSAPVYSYAFQGTNSLGTDVFSASVVEQQKWQVRQKQSASLLAVRIRWKETQRDPDDNIIGTPVIKTAIVSDDTGWQIAEQTTDPPDVSGSLGDITFAWTTTVDIIDVEPL